MSIHYISVVAAARETVSKMLTQRTGQQGFNAVVTTYGGKTAAVVRQGYDVRLDLPSLAPDTVLTRAEADRMVAYLVHEVCHCLHTDYTVWQQAVAEGHRVRHWTNALEDVRIEALEMRVGPYKAMKSLLSGLVCHLYAEAHTSLGMQGMTLGQGMLNAPYVVTVLGRAANGYDLPITRTLEHDLAPNVRKVVSHALANLKACRSTLDCLRLARELVALEQSFKQQQPQQQPQPGPKPPQQPQQPQPGQGDQGEGDQGDDQGDDMREGDDQGDDQGEGDKGAPEKGSHGAQEPDQGKADDHEGDQGGHGEGDQGDQQAENGDREASQGDNQGDQGDVPGGDATGDSGDQDDDQGDDQGQEIEPDLNLGKTAENIIERTGKDASRHDRSHHLNSMEARRKNARDMHVRDPNGARDMLNSMTPKNGVLHGQISRLLVSEARTAQTHHETSGRLDRRALVRIRTGAQDVFSRRDYAPGVDTAVMVLIDLSGSMRSRIDLARVTAWAMANAAESAGGKLCVAGFKGSEAACTLQYVKGWHETANQCAGALCSIEPNSYTPLSASIIAGAQDLADVQATRRILIALTDGQCDLGGEAVQSACRLASAMGVEAVGIGMACPEVVKAFPPRYSVNVQDLDQLATTGLGVLTRMLEETGGHR